MASSSSSSQDFPESESKRQRTTDVDLATLTPGQRAVVRGDRALKIGDYATAIIAYGTALSMGEKTSEIYENKAAAHFGEGEFQAVVDTTNECLKLYPKSIPAFQLLASAKMQLGDPDKAIETLNRALILDPKNEELVEAKKQIIKERDEKKRCVPADKAINFRLVSSANDFEEDQVFHPAFTHQLFEDEMVVGYDNPKIDIFFSACSLQLYLKFAYSSVLEKKEFGSLKRTAVESLLEENVLVPHVSTMEDFKKVVENDKNFLPEGVAIAENKDIIVIKMNMSTTQNQEMFDRLQLFCPFFIETGCFLPRDYPGLQCYVVYEKCGDFRRFVGFCTGINLYAFPVSNRLRISQVVVLPLFQGKGYGTFLLESIFEFVRKDNDVMEIVVEEPNNHFQAIRDRLDMKALINLGYLSGNTVLPFTKEQIQKIARHLKISKSQVHRCMELFQYKNLNFDDPSALISFRLQVKQRLYKSFFQKTELQKLQQQKQQNDEATPASIAMMTEDVSMQDTEEARKEKLHALYEELLATYEKTLKIK